jgi:hypothetical protein
MGSFLLIGPLPGGKGATGTRRRRAKAGAATSTSQPAVVMSQGVEPAGWVEYPQIIP